MSARVESFARRVGATSGLKEDVARLHARVAEFDASLASDVEGLIVDLENFEAPKIVEAGKPRAAKEKQ